MYDVMLTFRSITAASRAAQQLQNAGIQARLLRTPQALRQKGCGYSLRLRGQSLAAAKRLLRGKGLMPQGIYRSRPDGHWEEVGE